MHSLRTWRCAGLAFRVVVDDDGDDDIEVEESEVENGKRTDQDHHGTTSSHLITSVKRNRLKSVRYR